MAHAGSWKRLGDGSLLTEDAHEGLGHVLPLKTYLTTLGILLVLTVFTVWVAQYDFGAWNAVVALTVASIKAALVCCFFMHLKFEGGLIWMFVIYPLIILFLLIGGSFMDFAEREAPVPMSGRYEVYVPKGVDHGGEHHQSGGH